MASNKSIRGPLGALFMTAALLISAQTADAKQFEVTTRHDRYEEECPVGDCSLREAVFAAGFTPGPDRIMLPSKKRYQLSIMDVGVDYTSGDLDVFENSLTVVHPGPGKATIDFNPENDGLPDPLDRIFHVYPDGALTLRRIKLTDGGDPSDSPDGGAIRAFGDLTLKHSSVVGNESPGYGGGIFTGQGAALSLVDSVVARNTAIVGGGIVHSTEGQPDPLSIRRSTISGNEAVGGNGGGIFMDASTTRASVSDTTVSGNRAAVSGGGFWSEESPIDVTGSTFVHNRAREAGGGLGLRGSPISFLSNSTFAANRAGTRGGGLYIDSQASINSVTIAGNQAGMDGSIPAGGGVYSSTGGHATVENSLFAHNTVRLNGTHAPNDCEGDDPFVSAGHNLLSTRKLCAGFQEDTDRVSRRPRLGDLRFNGGPTATIALLSDSPAIDRASESSPDVDQRGRRRHDPDIGAFERTAKDR